MFHQPVHTLSGRRVFSGAEIAEIAKGFRGVHGQAGGRMTAPDEGLDTVGLILRIAAEIGEPLNIDPDWPQFGGDLPLTEINIDYAAPGDVLTFDFTAAKRRPCQAPHHLGLLSFGTSAHAGDARIVCVPHAVSVCWLAGAWARHMVRAWRFAARREG